MFPIALTRTDAEEEREEAREEKEHDAVRCEFERCKKQHQELCEDFSGGDELFSTIALRFFKRVETADATGTQRAESIILSNYYFLRAFFLYACACIIIRPRKEDFKNACFTPRALKKILASVCIFFLTLFFFASSIE